MPCSFGSSGITIKPKATKQNFCQDHVNPTLHATKILPQKNPAHFLKLYYDISFQEPTVNGRIFTSASQISTSATLLLLLLLLLLLYIAGNRKAQHWGELQWYSILSKVL
jgi:hypothetical protein